MKTIIILLSTSFIWLTSCAQEPTESTGLKTEESSIVSKRVAKEEFKKVLLENSNAQLVDVRTPNEYESGKIN